MTDARAVFLLLAATCCLAGCSTPVAGTHPTKPLPDEPPPPNPTPVPQRNGWTATQHELELVPLPISYPRPMFYSYTGGGPVTARFAPGTNGYESPAMLTVPKDAFNVALRKKVTSSDGYAVVGELDMVTDGNNSGGEGALLEIGPGRQWIQIDLGGTFEVFAVAIWRHPYDYPTHVYHDMVVRVAGDAEISRDVRTVFNNDHDNSLGLGKGSDYEYQEGHYGKVIPCTDPHPHGVSGRYVRIWTGRHTAGRDEEQPMTQYAEVEVWGVPSPR